MNQPARDDLSERLERLEGKSRRWQRFGPLAAVGLAVLAALGARNADVFGAEQRLGLGAAADSETLDPKGTSDDPDYGYSKKKPIAVGHKDELGGPAAERAYFESLRDETGKPVTFERDGSFGPGPDGHILDGYAVTTAAGKTVTLFIDMYHPKNDPADQLAPKGFLKAKK